MTLAPQPPSKMLALYLDMARQVKDLDDRAEQLRDFMDPVWWALTEDERDELNGRNERHRP